MKKNRIAYLRSTSIVNDSRATKEIESYKKYNNDVIAFGWNRQNINIQKLDEKYKFYNKQSKYGSGMKNIFKLLGFEIWLYNNLKKERNNYDIIHACDFDTAYIGYKISKKYNKKLVYHVYDYYVDCHNLSFLKDFIEKKDIKILNNADAVIICTEQRKKQIEKANPKKIYVIHNTPEIKKIKCQNSYTPNKIKVCYVGILQDDRLLKEVCEEISKNSNIELHIGGFGKYEEYIKGLSNQYSNIFFYGQLKYDDVLDLEEFKFKRIVENDKNRIIDLFTVTGRLLLFKNSELYSKYFEWYTSDVTLEEVKNIYAKYNMLFPDVAWFDDQKEKDNAKVLKISKHK